MKQKETNDISIRRFVLYYLIMMGVFFSLLWIKPAQDIIDLNGLYTRWVVIITSKLLGLISIPSTYHDTIIRLPSITLDVQFGCNGLEAVLIYAAAVVAFPATWRKKSLGVLAGFLVIQSINVLRIVGLAYSGVHYRKFFDVIHIYVAQGIMIAIAFGIFLFYLKLCTKT